jgi:hypothetical protein
MSLSCRSSVDERTIGGGVPAPVTHKLLTEFRRRARQPAADPVG